MEFYEAVGRRRTVRHFTGEAVPEETLKRILETGLKAPSNDHLRQWEFVVLQKEESIAAALGMVEEQSRKQREALAQRPLTDLQKEMYDAAVPRQYRMLAESGCVILPFYKQNGDLLKPAALQTLNGFAAIWCCIENILLAAAAEGMGCTIRIPTGDEWRYVAERVKAPEGYVLPCYIGLGWPAPDQPAVKQHPIKLEEKLHWEQW